MNWTNPPHWLFPAHHCLHAYRSLPPMLAKSRPLSQSRPEWTSNPMSKTKKEYLLPPANDALGHGPPPPAWDMGPPLPDTNHGTSLPGYQTRDLPSRVPDMGPPFPDTNHGTSLPGYQTWDVPLLSSLFPVHPFATDIWWSLLEICSNLFNWGPTHPFTLHHQYWYLVVDAETHTVGKRAVHIPLGCYLVWKSGQVWKVSWYIK